MEAAMTKIDLKKELRELYNTGAKARKPHFVTVPTLQYIMVDGRGDPNTSEEFQAAMGSLYPIAYTVKFESKAGGSDFTVMPLEGLWWTDPPEAFASKAKSDWLWTVMLLQPDFVTRNMIDDAVATCVGGGKIPAEVAGKIRLERLDEGIAGQILHIGPYADEGPTIRTLHGHMRDSGYRLRGRHHEIYMSDPRRVAPENMKTIIRQPMEKA